MRYRMLDGTIVDTRRAKLSWGEKDTPGRKRAGQRLYKSRKGRYYVEFWADTVIRRVSTGRVEWVSPEAACRWLIQNEHPLPEDLKGLITTV